jgi:hypothetical protein
MQERTTIGGPTVVGEVIVEEHVRAMAQAVSPGFDPESVHVGFVVDKVALGQVFPRVLRFSRVNFIPPVFHYLKK